MADSTSLSILRQTPLSSSIATKEWTEENFAHLSGQIWYGECSTAAATAAKAVTIPGITALMPGMNFRIYFTYAQTYNGAPTLNVNGLGAKNIKRVGTTNAVRYEWVAGETLDFVYDDDYFRMIDGGFATTSYYGVTRLASTATTTSDSYAATPGAIFKVVGNTVYGILNTWTKNTQYSVGDKVYNAGKYYECIEANSSATFDATKFREIDNAQTQIDNLSDAIADIDIPEVPTDLSAFTNSPGYLTAHQSLSDLYILSGEVVEGLSNVVIPKLDTISGLVEDEVEKVDEISAKFDNYSLTGHTHTSSDITNFPPIPTVNNGTLTIQKNGTDVQTFTANQTDSVTANISVPTDLSDLTNNAGYAKKLDLSSLHSLSNYIPLSGNAKIASAFVLSSNGSNGYKQTINLWGGDGDGEGDTAIGYNAIVENSHGMAAGGGVAVGSNAKAKSVSAGSSIAIGSNAIASNIDSIQLGWGTNNTASTLQIWDKPLLERTGGKIFFDRIPTGTTSSTVAIGNHTHSEYALTSSIPTKTSELTNDSGFLTAHQSLSDYTLTSDFKDLISTVTDELSSNINPKLSTIADQVSAETQKVDEISARLDDFALTSDIPSDLSDLTNNAGYALISDIPQVEGKYLHLSGDTVSSDFALKIAGNNVLSGLNGNLAIGKSSQAPGTNSTALGYFAKATGIKTTAFGDNAQATGGTSTALGYSAKASTSGTTAIGESAQATGIGSTALGAAAQATVEYSTAIGKSAQATSSRSTAFGYSAQASTNGTTAIGSGAKALSAYSTALGNNTKTAGQRAIAIGYRTAATATNAIQIGTVDNNDLSNNVADTLQIWDKPLLERTGGKIFIERIPTGTTSATVALGNHTHSEYALTSQLNDYALSSDLFSLSSQVVNGLSNTVTLKLSTIADLISGETKKLDELSGSLSEYALTSQIPTKVSELSNDSRYIKKTELQSDLSNYLPLSGGMISGNFALSVADEYGNGSYNFLSGVTRGLAFGFGSSATGAGAEAIGTGAVAKGHESFATGRGAKIQNEYNVDCVAVGFNAVVNAGSSYADGDNAIQLGYGMNTTPHTMQVFNHTLMDTVTGDIPYERLSTSLDPILGNILSTLQVINGTVGN